MLNGERLRQYRETLNMTQKQVAEQIGVAPQTYANYEQGRREPDYETLGKIAQLFGTSMGQLLQAATEIDHLHASVKTDPSRSPGLPYWVALKPIPILGRIHAGQPLEAQPYIEGVTYITTDVPGDFGLVVEGDCMEPHLLEGDLVICQQVNGTKPQAGQVVVALIEGEVVIRRLRCMQDVWVLHASNPQYHDIPLRQMDIIQGIVLQVTRRVASEHEFPPDPIDNLTDVQRQAVLNLIRSFQNPNV